MNTININEIKSPATKDITKDILTIIEQSQRAVYTTIDLVLLKRNWLIGKRIYEEELKETRKENYGKEIIKKLSIELIRKYGGGFSERNLYNYYKFYTLYKNILQSSIAESFLSWTHYRLLIRITDKEDKPAIEIIKRKKAKLTKRYKQKNRCAF